MLSELFEFDVQMPLGYDPEGDFSAFATAFQIESVYGLTESTGSTFVLSHRIQISTDPDDLPSRLHAIIAGQLRFEPAAGTEDARLELWPFPFEVLGAGELMGSAFLPSLVIYQHVDPTAIRASVADLLSETNLTAAEQAARTDDFMAGIRSLVVQPGDTIGRGAADDSLGGRRRVDLSMQDREGFYFNPAHYLVQWPAVNESLQDHPLLTALASVQHTNQFATKSRILYVKQVGSTPAAPYDTPETAAATINDAVVEALPGDSVLILDNAVYPEVLAMPAGVSLTSAAAVGKLDRLESPPAEYPSMKGTGLIGEILQFDELTGAPTHVSGIILEEGTGNEDGGGVFINKSIHVEISGNVIRRSRAKNGGAVRLSGSRNVTLNNNLILDNIAEENGGGISVGVTGLSPSGFGDPCSFILIQNNQIHGNSAGGFGGGIAIHGAANVRIHDNRIRSNTAFTFGGGVSVDDSQTTSLTSNEIGGLLETEGNQVTGDRSPPVSSVLLDDPQGGGGGVGVLKSVARILRNTISHNQAHAGGGIEFYAGAGGIVAGNEIIHNCARPSTPAEPFPVGGDGGGVAVNHTSITKESADRHRVVQLTNNVIRHNDAGDDGGAVYGTAKALLVIAGDETQIAHNTAFNNGGGVRVTFGSQLAIGGGVIERNRANLASSL